MKNKIASIDISSRFQHYISEIEDIIRPDLKNEIKKIREMDLHDYFFSPKHWFGNEIEAKGFVISLFMKQSKKKLL